MVNSWGPEHQAGSYPRLSPDGNRLAFDRPDPRAALATSGWRICQRRHHPLDLSSWLRLDSNLVAGWKQSRVRVQPRCRDGPVREGLNGSEPEQPLLKSDKRKMPTDWSRDGEFLLFDQEDPASGWDLWALPMKGDRQPFPILQSEFNETRGRSHRTGSGWPIPRTRRAATRCMFSPSLAGQPQRKPTALQLKVAHLGRWRGTAPLAIRWQGIVLYEPGPQVRVRIHQDRPPVRAGLATPLFDSTTVDAAAGFDVTPDGKRFLIPTVSDDNPRPLTLFVNWTAALKK